MPAPDPHAVPLKSLGANVKRLREKRGLTQHALAEAAGVSQRFIASIEAGRDAPSLKRLVTLGETLGVDARELLRPAIHEPRAPGRPKGARAGSKIQPNPKSAARFYRVRRDRYGRWLEDVDGIAVSVDDAGPYPTEHDLEAAVRRIRRRSRGR